MALRACQFTIHFPNGPELSKQFEAAVEKWALEKAQHLVLKVPSQAALAALRSVLVACGIHSFREGHMCFTLDREDTPERYLKSNAKDSAIEFYNTPQEDVCTFFWRGECAHATKCPFRHVFAPLVHQSSSHGLLCPRFEKSSASCPKGDACQFAHLEPEFLTVPKHGKPHNGVLCLYQLHGQCTNPKCPFAHADLKSIERIAPHPSSPSFDRAFRHLSSSASQQQINVDSFKSLVPPIVKMQSSSSPVISIASMNNFPVPSKGLKPAQPLPPPPPPPVAQSDSKKNKSWPSLAPNAAAVSYVRPQSSSSAADSLAGAFASMSIPVKSKRGKKNSPAVSAAVAPFASSSSASLVDFPAMSAKKTKKKHNAHMQRDDYYVEPEAQVEAIESQRVTRFVEEGWEKDAEVQLILQEMEDREETVPDEYICPVTHCLLFDPVEAADGIVYERTAIEDWFAKKKGADSPLCIPMKGDMTLKPRNDLKAQIGKWIEKQKRMRFGDDSSSDDDSENDEVEEVKQEEFAEAPKAPASAPAPALAGAKQPPQQYHHHHHVPAVTLPADFEQVLQSISKLLDVIEQQTSEGMSRMSGSGPIRGSLAAWFEPVCSEVLKQSNGILSQAAACFAKDFDAVESSSLLSQIHAIQSEWIKVCTDCGWGNPVNNQPKRFAPKGLLDLELLIPSLLDYSDTLRVMMEQIKEQGQIMFAAKPPPQKAPAAVSNRKIKVSSFKSEKYDKG